MTDEQDPEIEPFAVPNPPAVAPGELIASSWGNSVVNAIGNIASLPTGSGTGTIANHLFDNKNAIATTNANINNILHPPTQVPQGMAGRSVSTTEVPIGQFTIPTTGLYLIGYQLDIAAGTGFGFLDAYLKVGTAAIPAVIPCKWFEPGTGSRAAANGLALADFNAGAIVQLMAKTFGGTVTVNGATVTAPLLRTP